MIGIYHLHLNRTLNNLITLMASIWGVKPICYSALKYTQQILPNKKNIVKLNAKIDREKKILCQWSFISFAFTPATLDNNLTWQNRFWIWVKSKTGKEFLTRKIGSDIYFHSSVQLLHNKDLDRKKNQKNKNVQ